MPATLPALTLAVVGVRHPNSDKSKSNRAFEILLCTPGDPVELRPEPRNRHDPHAVAVFSSRGIQIGYLTAERCGRIGGLIREGREVRAVFQEGADFGAWIRVAFDGAEPLLPLKRPGLRPARDTAADPSAEFYPDEEWPDEGDQDYWGQT